MNSFTPSIFKSNTVASTASMRPVGKKKTMTSNNEIFVDIFERLSVSIKSRNLLKWLVMRSILQLSIILHIIGSKYRIT